MANKIQLRRGLKSEMPSLSSGEPCFTIDTHEFFMGTGTDSENVNMTGSLWYFGSDMTGSDEQSCEDCDFAKIGDVYFNTSTGELYKCTTSGVGKVAKWTYQCKLDIS